MEIGAGSGEYRVRSHEQQSARACARPAPAGGEPAGGLGDGANCQRAILFRRSLYTSMMADAARSVKRGVEPKGRNGPAAGRGEFFAKATFPRFDLDVKPADPHVRSRGLPARDASLAFQRHVGRIRLVALWIELRRWSPCTSRCGRCVGRSCSSGSPGTGRSPVGFRVRHRWGRMGQSGAGPEGCRRRPMARGSRQGIAGGRSSGAPWVRLGSVHFWAWFKSRRWQVTEGRFRLPSGTWAPSRLPVAAPSGNLT